MIELHAYCCLCILSEKCVYLVFLVKISIFHLTQGMLHNLLYVLITSELIISVFLDSYMHTCLELCILGQKAVFL